MPSEVPSSATRTDRPGEGNHPSRESNTIGALLKMALLNGVQEAVLRHIKLGGDVNAIDASGQTPLMLAAFRGHLDICKLLIEAGASVSIRDFQGRDALSIAIHGGHTEVTNFLNGCSTVPKNRLLPERGRGPVSLIQDSEPGFSTELSSWEEASDAGPSTAGLELLASAKTVHDRMSAHIPVTTDNDWSDISVELPPSTIEARSNTNVPNGRTVQSRYLSVTERIRAATEELRALNGVFPTLSDLMAHASTRGVTYPTVKKEYMQWRAASLKEKQSSLGRPGRYSVLDEQPINTVLQGAEQESVVIPSDVSDDIGSAAVEPPRNNNSLADSTGSFQSTKSVDNLKKRNVARPLLTSSEASIWAAADELTLHNGSPATLLDLVGHPSTRGISYKNVKVEYARWRSHHDAHGGVLVQAKPLQAAKQNPKLTSNDSVGSDAVFKPVRAADSEHLPNTSSVNSTRHSTEKGVTERFASDIQKPHMERPLLTTWAARVWAVADELSASNGSAATMMDLLRHKTTRSYSYKTLMVEYERWRSYYDAHCGVPHDVNVVRASMPVEQEEGISGMELENRVVVKPSTNFLSTNTNSAPITYARGNTYGAGAPIGRPSATSLAGRIWAAADEVTSHNGIPATVSDLMVHTVTRGMNYRGVKAQYDRWRSYYDSSRSRSNVLNAARVGASAQAISPHEHPDIPSIAGIDPEVAAKSNGSFHGIDIDGCYTEQAGSLNSASNTSDMSQPAHATQSLGIARPSSLSVEGRIWAAAEEITARNRVPATLLHLRTHAVARGVTYNTMKIEYVRWRAFYDSQHSAPVQTKAGSVRKPIRKSPLHTQRPSSTSPIWAAAENISKGHAAGVTIALLLGCPALKGVEQQNIKREFAKWRVHKGLPPLAEPKPVEIPSKPKMATVALPCPSESASWDEVAKYIASSANLTVKDMRPMNGYFWILASSVNTDALRTVARKLLDMGFECVENFGFRKK